METNAVTLDEFSRELPEGFYTTFTTHSRATKVLGLQQHLNRLFGPAKRFGIVPAVSVEFLREQIASVAALNLPRESRVRLMLLKGSGELFIGIQPFTALDASIYTNGVHVISAGISRKDPQIKDTSFINASMKQRKLLNNNIFEVLLTRGGRILEGMTSNFFAIKGGTLVTAPRGVLPGVTRRVVLRLAKGQGMSIVYRSPWISEKYDEAFLTSSSRGVVPIVSIDHEMVGEGKPGNWTKILLKAYQGYVEKRGELLIQQDSHGILICGE